MVLVLVAVTFIAVVAMLFVPRIPQPLSYHAFVDDRTIWGIPNAWNVLSNLPFVLVGSLGLWCTRRNMPGELPELRTLYRGFFAGVLLTGFGSGYYHLDPSNGTLVWDRLPMTIAFMAFFCCVVGEHVSLSASRRLIWILLPIGIASVLYWHVSELRGSGDLRPYALVQFLPMLLIPLMLWLFPSRLSGVGYLWAAIGGYALSKLAEALDQQLFDWLGGSLSGHSIKHLLAAGGTLLVYLALRGRRPVADTRPTGSHPLPRHPDSF
jgi:hypothetical protein